MSLLTKLFVPAARPELVARPRLLAQLDAGLDRGLTLVSAPPGFGKTTLLAQWLAALPRASTAAAWLSLDADDNDPARFLAYLAAALQRANPAVGQALAPPFLAPDGLLAGLVNDLAGTEKRLVLVLDDYHTIHSLPIHQHLAFLAHHMPPPPGGLHLVIATREDPPLPLGRLRATGQVAEIRQADLRFSPEEVAQFLARAAQLQLAPGDAAAVYQRTEGWIAGLQLLALSLRGRDDVPAVIRSFTGSHRYVLDYLMEEVFDRQPAALQEFLVKTSILDRLCGPLCDAVIGEAGKQGIGEAGNREIRESGIVPDSPIPDCPIPDSPNPLPRYPIPDSPIPAIPMPDTRYAGRRESQSILERLERANLFVVPLDANRHWYRYHHLFADLLRHRLELGAPDDVPRLHRLACAWYAAHDLPADAMRHALAARDWSRAGALLAAGLSGSLLQRGELATLLGWFRALPQEVVWADARLCLEASWPLILTEQLDAAEPLVARAEELATARGDTALLGEITVARVHVARTRGNHPLAMELSERALALLPAEHLSARSVVAVNLGLAYWFIGRLAEAERTLAEAERAGRGSGNDYARFTALVFRNRVRMARGGLRQGAAACRETIDQGGQLPAVAMAHYDLARLLYEWNDLAAAVDQVQRGLALSRRSGAAELLAAGHGLLALFYQAMGQAGAATDALRRAGELLEQPGISPGTRLYNLGCQILVGLGQGDLDAARLQGPTPESGSLADALFLALARGRLLLARGEQPAAAEHLARLHALAAGAGWQAVATQARALQALAAPGPGEARAFLLEALVQAEPEGYLRTFLDGGPPMHSLLASLSPSSPYATALLAAFAQLEQPAAAASPACSIASTGPSSSVAHRGPSSLPDPLTPRELDVLRLLAAGHTNQEMALALVVSTNTVKTHLKNIYDKLGVSGRRQAIARAASLGLL